MPPQEPQLRDIHVPHVSWWPLAAGWWMLAGLVVVATILLLWRWRMRVRHRRFVETVLGGLRDARARHAADGDDAAFVANAHALLRRVARTRDPASVSYAATAWRDALASMAPKSDVARLASLGDAMYRPGMKVDVDAVASDVDAWVREVLSSRTAGGWESAHVAS